MTDRIATSRRPSTLRTNNLKKKHTTETDLSDFGAHNLSMAAGYSQNTLNLESITNLMGKHSVILERSNEFELPSFVNKENHEAKLG